MLAVIYGIKQIAQDGFGTLPAAVILAGLAAGGLFVRRQLALADPLIDLRLFRIPTFSVSLATNLLAIFVAVGYFLFIAQYLQLVLGLSPWQAGLWSLPSAAGFIAGSNLAPRFVHRFRPAIVLGAWPGTGGHRAGVAHAGGRSEWARHRRGCIGGHLAGSVAGVHADDRADRRERSARAGRGRLGDLGDRLRARRGAGHRNPGQHRHGRVPQRGGQWSPGRCARRGGGDGSATRWAVRWRWLSSCPTRCAWRCSTSHGVRSCRVCSCCRDRRGGRHRSQRSWL